MKGKLARRERSWSAYRRAGKMGPTWPPVGGSSTVSGSSDREGYGYGYSIFRRVSLPADVGMLLSAITTNSGFLETCNLFVGSIIHVLSLFSAQRLFVGSLAFSAGVQNS